MQRDDDLPELGALDHEDEALVAKLRALPPLGGEPDWKKLEAAIRAEVGHLSMPLPWWRRWQWLVPIGALAATAAIVLVVSMRRGGEQTIARTATRDAGVLQTLEPAQPSVAVEKPAATAPAMWLDGEPVDLDDLDDASLDSLDDLVDIHDTPAELRDVAMPEAAPATGDDDSIEAMLPVSDYGWLDSLDDAAAARVEQVLGRKRS